MKDVVGKGSWKTEVGKFDRKLLRMKLESWAEVRNYNWSWKVTEEVGKFWMNFERINEVGKLLLKLGRSMEIGKFCWT